MGTLLLALGLAGCSGIEALDAHGNPVVLAFVPSVPADGVTDESSGAGGESGGPAASESDGSSARGGMVAVRLPAGAGEDDGGEPVPVQVEVRQLPDGRYVLVAKEIAPGSSQSSGYDPMPVRPVPSDGRPGSNDRL